MKAIILCGVVAVILQLFAVEVGCHASTDEAEKKLDEIETEIETLNDEELACVAMTNVDQEVALHAKKTNRVPANIQSYKDFLSCCWKLYGYQADDGTLNWDKIREVLEKAYPAKIANALVKKCDKIRGVTEGDTVALVLRCLDDHAPNIRNIHRYHAGAHG